MSNYEFKAKNKETGTEHVVMALDDYYGKHMYAYLVDDNHYRESEFNNKYERVAIDTLTYKEQYEVPITLVVNEFGVEYAECGSHQLRINAIADLEKLQELYELLGGIKGIK